MIHDRVHFSSAAPPSTESSGQHALVANPTDMQSAQRASTNGTVAICIPTCQRPKNLAELLTSVLELDTTGVALHVIVVDNDAARSALPVVQAVMQGSDVPVTYDCIEKRGLPLVRNRLIELATELHVDWVWLLDDDQIVEPNALRLMLATATTYNADCVVARVPHTFENSSSPWAHWSGIFKEIERPTGRVTKSYGSNGPLLRFASVAKVSEPFDTRLRLTGGEDSLFFARFSGMGFRSVGCNEAVIYDRIHASRNNPRWLTQRALRIGLVKGIIVREVRSSPVKSMKWLVLGAGYAVLNLLVTVVLLPFGPARYFRYWIRAMMGYGTVVGLVIGRKSLRGQEYSVIHGE